MKENFWRVIKNKTTVDRLIETKILKHMYFQKSNLYGQKKFKERPPPLKKILSFSNSNSVFNHAPYTPLPVSSFYLFIAQYKIQYRATQKYNFLYSHQE